MKPDWKDAPEWAQWLALDASGVWYWYEQAPTIAHESDYWNAEGAMAQAAESIYWKESAEPRP